jgi:hypothetical protein
MSKAMLVKYVSEIRGILESVLDDDYPDAINDAIVMIAERDGLSDTESELLWETVNE